MRLIIITSPVPVAGEASILCALAESNIWRIHLRKPDWTIEQTRNLLRQLPDWALQKISLHDHHELARDHAVGGIHLNRRNRVVIANYEGLISCSCHSLEEVKRSKSQCDYHFLSPIYDSISKKGLLSHFSKEELSKASEAGIIDECTFALGGVTLDKLPELQAIGFGGAAILGEFWESVAHNYWREYLSQT